MIFQPIFFVVPLLALGLIAGLVFGIVGWKQPTGKAITIIAGLLLLGLLAFVVIVALLAWSSERGHPM